MLLLISSDSSAEKDIFSLGFYLTETIIRIWQSNYNTEPTFRLRPTNTALEPHTEKEIETIDLSASEVTPTPAPKV